MQMKHISTNFCLNYTNFLIDSDTDNFVLQP